MNKTTALNRPADDASDYEAEVDRYLAQMTRLQQQMNDDRQEIQTLQAETNAILANIMQTLKAA